MTPPPPRALTSGPVLVPAGVERPIRERIPGAIHTALQRRPDWLQAFEREWLGAAAEFDQAALDAVAEKWFPFACACATPGHLDGVGQTNIIR
ncbi:hypothetical protein [Streptomyces prunicolor]